MLGAGQKTFGQIVWFNAYHCIRKSLNEKSCQGNLTAFLILVPEKGIEPSTFSLQVSCSTN